MIKSKIGIGITTHNRRETALHTVSQVQKFAPLGARIVIVDDASDVPFPLANYRFDEQAGIAASKNKCLELLDDCEHIFLFDDDVYPTTSNWHLPYTLSTYNHMCFTWGRKVVSEVGMYTYYELPNGCMLYYRRACLELVGGFDTAYTGYGFEHVDLSRRIYNAGLIPHPFIDLTNSLGLFYSYDYHNSIKPSTTGRANHIPANRSRYNSLGDSSHYIPYK